MSDGRNCSRCGDRTNLWLKSGEKAFCVECVEIEIDRLQAENQRLKDERDMYCRVSLDLAEEAKRLRKSTSDLPIKGIEIVTSLQSENQRLREANEKLLDYAACLFADNKSSKTIPIDQIKEAVMEDIKDWKPSR